MKSPSATIAGTSLWRRVRGGDDGYAAVLVIGTMSLLALLLPLMLSLAMRDLDDSTRHHRFDAAQDAARSGVQSVIASLTTNPAYTAGPTVDAAVAQSGWPSQSAQYTWARDTLLTQAAVSPSVVRTTPTGRYVVLRPANQRAVYALGWPLDGTAARQGKVLVAEYTYPTRSPGAALLAGSEVYLSGSFDLRPSSDTTLPADLHTNGNLTGSSSSATVTGTATASGTSSSTRATGGAPSREIPQVDPRQYYAAYSGTYADSWYDLCPNGFAYRVSPSGVPCTDGIRLASPPANWTWNSGSKSWTENGSGGPAGVYYVYGADAVLDSAGPVDQTVITEARLASGQTANFTCQKPDNGSISVTKATVRAFLPGAALVSGNKITITSQGATYGGVVAAQESVSMSSSSAPGITGYVIAQNSCSGEVNSFQGSSIVYDPTPGFLSPGPPRITAESELLQG
jgi:hypothetical protein